MGCSSSLNFRVRRAQLLLQIPKVTSLTVTLISLVSNLLTDNLLAVEFLAKSLKAVVPVLPVFHHHYRDAGLYGKAAQL